jgi:hypothetical protein
VIILGFFHFSLVVIALTKKVIYHEFGLDVFGLPRILKVLFENDNCIIVEFQIHNNESQTHESLSFNLGKVGICCCHSGFVVKVESPVFIFDLVADVCSQENEQNEEMKLIAVNR